MELVFEIVIKLLCLYVAIQTVIALLSLFQAVTVGMSPPPPLPLPKKKRKKEFED